MGLALITGASRGIGRHLAGGFAAAGWDLLITATTAERAEACAELLAGHGGTVRGAALDVTDPQSLAALTAPLADLERDTGQRLSLLINNAGVIEAPEGPVWDVPAEELRRTLMTNTLGPFLTIRHFAPTLLETAAHTGKPARIIDLNSGSGAQGTPAYAAYSASKAALFRLAQSVHHHGWERGLRIFELAPGVIRSDMTASMPMHDWRTDADWTDPADVVALALALASGELDAYSGRYVRAGLDTPDSLAERARAGLPEGFRQLGVEMD